MARRNRRMPPQMLARLLGGENLTEGRIEERLDFLSTLRGESPEASRDLDRTLLQEVSRVREALEAARATQAEMRELLEKLTAPPWHVATFLASVTTALGPRFEVLHRDARRLVAVHQDVEPSELRCGDEVYLNEGLNMVMGKSLVLSPGETAVFDRRLTDGRMVIRSRDEEIVVLAAAVLEDENFEQGNLVRWSRTSMMAFERVESAKGEGMFLEGKPAETFNDIGGLDREIEKLKRAILLRHDHPDKARKYDLSRAGSVLLVGPPGTGKTLIARGLASWLGDLSPSGRSRFMNIKPGSLHSVWYSQSEQNYREVFRIAREAGESEPDVPVVLFFDEVDAVSSTRGASMTRVDDRVLMAFAAELDGLESRGNVMVVGATNRPDSVDPAIMRPGRLADRIINVPRPDRNATGEIFGKHLRPDMPYRANGSDNEAARQEIFESALSRIFSPNGAGDLASITFADGSRRPVRPGDLISGAVIASIALGARERACAREVDTGEGGIRLEDVLVASEEVFAESVRVLTRANCANYLQDMPQDLVVTRVDLTPRRVHRQHRYLSDQ